MIESNIDFIFDEKYKVFKFDDTKIFNKFNNGIKNGKGVDFIAHSEDKVILLEVKNCKGYESENRWRTSLKSKQNSDGTIDDCFDVEVAKKVSCTISCLTGAGTFDKYNCDDEYDQFSQVLSELIDNNHKIEVIFFLEGDFGSKTRSKKMIMDIIQTRLKKHFKGWLNLSNCRVIDSDISNNDVQANLISNDT